MSLINDALKKAEQERSRRADSAPPSSPESAPKVPAGRKRWRYLRGFLLSLLIVGTLSTIATTYLVNQLLKDQGTPGIFDRPAKATDRESATESQEHTSIIEAVETTVQENVELMEELNAILPAEAAKPATPEQLPSTQAPPPSTSPVPADKLLVPSAGANVADKSPADNSPVPNEESAPEDEDPTTVGEDNPRPETPINSLENLTSVFLEKLAQLEIRGIMQGSGRALIFDSATGKTHAYSVGDPIDGHPDFRVASIENKSVLIKGPKDIQHTLNF